MKGIYTRKHEWHCPYCIGGVWSKRNYEDMLPLIAEHKKSHMKPLKKHPKQQRMEEMTFPIIKPFKFYGAHDGTCGTSGGNLMGCEHGVDKRTICTQCENKVTMTGREYLRSINDDNGFTLMPRLMWRVVAVVILVIICLVVIL